MKISDIFEDKDVKKSFLNILKRHYFDIFLISMNPNSISKNDIDTFEKIGYSKKEIKLVNTNSKVLLVFLS